jgi:hypothetical protein
MPTIGPGRRASLVGIAVAGLAGAALGQSYRLSHVGIEEGSWFFTPILRVDTDPQRVDSLVALAKIGAASGDNIVAVWYQRDATSDTTWTTKSWRTSSVEQAMKSVKVALSLPDEDDQWWPVGDTVAMNAIPTPDDPADYYKGLLADDALADLVTTSPDRDYLVSVLVAIGYKAADIDIEKVTSEQSCVTVDVLTAMAKGAEAGLSTSDSEAIEEVAASYVAAQCGWCISIPWTWYGTPTAWSTCVYPGFLFSSGVWDPLSGWWHCCYTNTCTCTQTRTKTTRDWHCVRTTITQTNTRTCVETDCCNMVARPCPAPNDPECVAQWGGGSTPVCSDSGWLP